MQENTYALKLAEYGPKNRNVTLHIKLSDV
jgi:hypothetical protein